MPPQDMTQDGGPVPILSVDELAALIEGAFPGREGRLSGEVVAVGPGFARLQLDPVASMGRPGGIVSGPTQMAMADHAAYAVVLAHIGPALMAVTHTLTMNFLRACRMERIVADAHLLKLGRRLATIDVRLWQGSPGRVVAQSTVGYALPAE